MTNTGVTGLNILPTHVLYVTVHAQLRASRHVTCLRRPQRWLFWKEGILHLPFTWTSLQIAAFTWLQMWCIFYLKGVNEHVTSELFYIMKTAGSSRFSYSVISNDSSKTNSLCCHDWMKRINKLILKSNIIYTVLLCLHVADPATFLASDSVLGPDFPLRTTCLFT